MMDRNAAALASSRTWRKLYRAMDTETNGVRAVGRSTGARFASRDARRGFVTVESYRDQAEFAFEQAISKALEARA